MVCRPSFASGVPLTSPDGYNIGVNQGRGVDGPCEALPEQVVAVAAGK